MDTIIADRARKAHESVAWDGNYPFCLGMAPEMFPELRLRFVNGPPEAGIITLPRGDASWLVGIVRTAPPSLARWELARVGGAAIWCHHSGSQEVDRAFAEWGDAFARALLAPTWAVQHLLEWRRVSTAPTIAKVRLVAGFFDIPPPAAAAVVRTL